MSFIKAIRLEDEPAPAPNPPGAGATPSGFETGILAAECANVRGAPEGARNHTLNKAAFNLAQIMPPDAFMSALLEAASHCGLDQAEAARTIRSGIAGAERNPRPEHRMPGRNGALRPVQTLPTLDGYQEPAAPLFVDWEALWADPGHIEWLCEPVIPAGRLVSLYSPPGVGKSLLALDLAVSIAQGTDALGVGTTQARVMYLDYENTTLDVRDRLQEMGHGPEGLSGLLYWSFPEIPPLDTPEGGQALLEAATAHGAGLVVIDTLSRCVQGDENEASTALNLYRCTLMGLKAAGIAVLRLDHTGKDETKGQRGTSAKSGDVDLVWRLSEVIPEETFLLTNEKHRIRISELRINIKRDDGPLRHRVDTRTIGQSKAEAILAACDAAGLPLNAGRDQVRRVMDAAGLKGRNDFIAELVRRRQGHSDLSPDLSARPVRGL